MSLSQALRYFNSSSTHFLLKNPSHFTRLISTFFKMNSDNIESAMDIENNTKEQRRQQDMRNVLEEIESWETESSLATTKIRELKKEMEAMPEDAERCQLLSEERRKKVAERATIVANLSAANTVLHQLQAKDRDREKKMRDHRAEAKHRNDQIKTIIGYRPSTITMKNDNNPEEFIKDFIEFIEIQLPGEEERKSCLIPILADSIKEDPKHAVFMKKLEHDKVPYWDLLDLKHAFLNHYAGKSWQATLAGRLANIAMGFENPSDYIGRIMRMTSQLGIRLDQKIDDGLRIIVRGWYFQLPHSVQLSMSSEMEEIYQGQIQTYLDAVGRHVPQKPERVEPCSLHCPYCPAKVEFTCSCPTMRRIGSRRVVKPISVENRGAPQGAPQKRARVDPEGSSRRRDLPKGSCFKCGIPDWTPQHRCDHNHSQSSSGRRTPAAGAMAVQEAPIMEIPEVLGVWERSDLEDSYDDGGYVSSAFTPGHNRDMLRPKVSLQLNGKLVPGLYVDTMSDLTLISPELLKEIEGKVALQSTTKNLRIYQL
jgi:hypothetical protein